MNRIITILVTIFILLLLYIWISHVWGSDKPRHPRQLVDARENQLSEDLITDADTMVMDGDMMQAEEQNSATETNESDDAKPEINDEPKKAEPKKEEVRKEEVKKSEPKPTPKKETNTPASTNKPVTTTTKPAVSSSTSSATGEQHLVIAGNFTQKANAEQRVKELKKAGFSDTEVVNFDLSEYFTVCVGRFSDVNEARKLVKKLKDYHKIDAYVRIGG